MSTAQDNHLVRYAKSPYFRTGELIPYGRLAELKRTAQRSSEAEAAWQADKARTLAIGQQARQKRIQNQIEGEERTL